MSVSGTVVLGQYRPLDSWLHRLDARAKLVPVVLILVLAMFSRSYLFHLVLLAGVGGSLLVSGIGLADLVRNFRPILYLALLTAVYHLIFSGGESEALISFWGMSLRIGAVHSAAFFTARLLLFISTAFFVTLTSSPTELAESLTRLIKPLGKFKIPVNDLGLILFIALRFIPILAEEFTAIRQAQMMRGMEFSGGYFRRIRRLGSLVFPVFVAAIERADDLALAIEARGYDSRVERTSYSTARIGNVELMFMIIVTVAIVGLFIVTRGVWLPGI